MKNNAFNKRKLRYASSSVALTALIIAAIIVVNIIFSALAQKFLWYVDMTPEQLFTLSDACFDLIEKGDESIEGSSSPVEMVEKFRAENAAYNEANGLKKGDAGWRDEELMIEIIFCDEPDAIEAELTHKYVYHTALELQDHFPEYIEVKCFDTVKNPSSVARFMKTSLDYVSPTHVIVSCGSEYRKLPLRSFYMFDSTTSDTPWAYNAEKKYSSAILAVTRTETPVACVTTNHGETMPSEDFLVTLEDAGYEVRAIDLSAEEIPEDCRLLVICNPAADFLVDDGISTIDEIEKIDDFLDATNSMMVFMAPTSPVLTNFEDYLEEWGIVFDRYTDALTGITHPTLISDKSQSLTIDGYTIISEYVTQGSGASLTEEMRSGGTPKKVVFKNAMPITYSSFYTVNHYADESTGVAFDYASAFVDGKQREVFDVFTTSGAAEAYANGEAIAKATDANPFKLMTVAVERRTTQESNYTTIDESSFVVACGSVEFLGEALIQSQAYGNSDLLLSTGRAIGQEPVPVGLSMTPFADTTIDTITSAEATQYIVTLTVIPALAALVTGTVIIIRRRNR